MAENQIEKKAEKALAERLGDAWVGFVRALKRVRGWVRVGRVCLKHLDALLDDLAKLDAEGSATALDT